MTKTIRARRNQLVDLKLTARERESVLGFLIMDDYLAERLRQARPQDSVVRFTLDDLLSLWGWFNAPGNQSRNEDLQAELDRIQRRIERLLPKDLFED